MGNTFKLVSMRKDELTQHSRRNLDVIENFILHITHCSNESDEEFSTPQTYTPEELYKLACGYILEEINRDRSGGWTDYNETDWVEGWECFVNGEFYELLTPYKIVYGKDTEKFLTYAEAYLRFVKLQGKGKIISLFELDSNNEYEVKNSSK